MHENDTLLERSKFSAPTEDLTKMKNLLSNFVVFESCCKRTNQHKIEVLQADNVTFLLLHCSRNFPLGCENAVLLNLLWGTSMSIVWRLRDNDDLCLFRALALHLHGIVGREEASSKLLNLSGEKPVSASLESFEVFVWKILKQWWFLREQKFSCTTLTS